jgi:hypothetical protein
MVFSRKTVKRGSIKKRISKKRISKKRISKKRISKKRKQRGGYTTVSSQSNVTSQTNQPTNINDYIYAITNSARKGFFAASI